MYLQCEGCDTVRSLLRNQLELWNNNQMDGFIDSERLRVYSLLAGALVWEASDKSINVCEGVDWRRCLALHLWEVLCWLAIIIFCEFVGTYSALFFVSLRGPRFTLNSALDFLNEHCAHNYLSNLIFNLTCRINRLKLSGNIDCRHFCKGFL